MYNSYIYMDVCVDYDAQGARHRLWMIKLSMVTIIINLVLQKCENGKAKEKHLPPKWTNKGQHELKYWHKHHRGVLTCSTESARMNNSAFFQKPCIWPHLIFFYALFLPHLVLQQPLWHFADSAALVWNPSLTVSAAPWGNFSSVSYLSDASLTEEWESRAFVFFWMAFTDVVFFCFIPNDSKVHILICLIRIPQSISSQPTLWSQKVYNNMMFNLCLAFFFLPRRWLWLTNFDLLNLLQDLGEFGFDCSFTYQANL